jgi:hypothetical protein
MILEEILAQASSKQRVIHPKKLGVGGYKGTRYFYDNGVSITYGTGVTHGVDSFKKLSGATRRTLIARKNDQHLFTLTDRMIEELLEMVEEAVNLK